MKKTSSTLISAAVAGLLFGAGCGNDTNPTNESGGQPVGDQKPSAAGKEVAALPAGVKLGMEHADYKHVCRTHNSCSGQGGCAVPGKHECAGKNDCSGKGGCATVAHHGCGGKNDCSGQGGCMGKVGKNDCAGKGGCAIPLKH